MKSIETLENEANLLLSMDSPSLSEMRKLSIEIDEFINSPEYHSNTPECQEQAQNLYRDISTRIRDQEDSGKRANARSENSISGRTPERNGNNLPKAPEHDVEAARLMDDAEKLFYGGRYAEAIKLYDQVLRTESSWDRARQHRSEAENYLRTGYIPSVALPSEAATAFGKAQSASRVGRYADAQAMLEKAKAALRDSGIQRWQEGQEFEQKLQQMIDAESAFQEGMKFFNQGLIDEAIEKIDIASQVTGMPRYKDKTQEFRKVKESLRSVTDILNSNVSDAKLLIQAKNGLDSLNSEYGENPAFKKLRTRLDLASPRIVEALSQQARSLLAQAERSQTLETAMSMAEEARKIVDQVCILNNQDAGRLQTEVDRVVGELRSCEEELSQAIDSYEKNKSWPVQAARMSGDVRRRFPSDPRVVKLNRNLAGYRSKLNYLRLGGIVIGIVILLLLVRWGRNQVIAMIPTATPTSTSTPTITPTFTMTPTATYTPTPTLTPTITPTPTLTPTPMQATLARNVWARTGCYESFSAIGKIPQGATIRLMPGDRRFDNLNRECLLVEYTAPDTSSVIGWILVADLAVP